MNAIFHYLLSCKDKKSSKKVHFYKKKTVTENFGYSWFLKNGKIKNCLKIYKFKITINIKLKNDVRVENFQA